MSTVDQLPLVTYTAQMQPVAVEYISTKTTHSGLHNYCFGGNRLINNLSS